MGQRGLLPGGRLYGEVDAVSCVSDGNCLAGEPTDDCYFDDPCSRGFLAQERNGRWGKAAGCPASRH